MQGAQILWLQKTPISSPFLTIVFDTWYVVFVLTCCAWFSLNVEHVWLHGQSSPLWISYFIGLFMWCLFPLLHHNGPSNLSHFFEHFCYLYFCRSTHIQRSCLINVIQKYDLYDDFTSRIGPIKPLCPPQLNRIINIWLTTNTSAAIEVSSMPVRHSVER